MGQTLHVCLTSGELTINFINQCHLVSALLKWSRYVLLFFLPQSFVCVCVCVYAVTLANDEDKYKQRTANGTANDFE